MATSPPVYSKEAKAAADGLRKAELDESMNDAVKTVAEKVAQIAEQTLRSDARGGWWPDGPISIKVDEQQAQRYKVVKMQGPWAGGAEWGGNWAHVYGHVKKISRFPSTLRGAWAVHVTQGGTKDGHIVGAAWNKFEGKSDEIVAEDVAEEIDDSLTRNGLP